MRRVVPALLLLALAAAAVGSDKMPAGGEFAAMATMTTNQGTRSMGFTIVVSNPRSPDQVLHLKQLLADGGQQALLNAIRGGGGGQFQLGALAYPIDLSVAEPMKDGARYLVVTARALKIEEVNEGRASLDHPFTVVVFEVPGIGRGQGHLYTQAALYVDEQGYVRVAQYEAEPGTLKDVRRVK